MHRRFVISLGIRFALILVILFVVGCGGGGSVVTPAPPPAPVPDFSLSVNGTAPSVQVQGAPQGVGVIISGTNGFSAAVTISLSGLPAGVTAQATSPTSALPESSVGFNLAASSSAAPGTVNITATGTSGSITHSISVPLTITPGARFQLSVTPSTIVLQPGQQTNLTVSLSVLSGTTPTYSFSTTGTIGLDHNLVLIESPALLPSPGNPNVDVVQAFPSADTLSPSVVTFTAVEEGTGQSSAASVTISVTAPFGVNTAPSRSTFATSNEAIYGGVYDPFRKLVFAAAESINSVLAFSSVDGHLVASIPVPQPSSIDETPDGASLFVGSVSDFLYRIDPNLMQVVQQYGGPPALPSGEQPQATRVITLTSGKLLVLATALFAGDDHIFLFDPSSQTWTNRDQPVPISGGYLYRRSNDHSTVVLTSGTSGALFLLYDANLDSFTTPLEVEFGGASGLAVSPDGSKIAIMSQSTMSYYDHNLQLQNQFTENGGVVSMSFSRDGQTLYLAESNSSPIVCVRNVADYALKGNVANLGDALGVLNPVILDVDETGMLFEANAGSTSAIGGQLGGEGVAFVDTSNPGLLNLPFPVLNGGNTVLAPSGLLNAPIATTVNGGGFIPGAQVFFGPAPASTQAQPGSNVAVQSTNVIQVVPPVGKASGPVNVTVVEPGGVLMLGPNAYSYGPQVDFIFPNAGPTAGGGGISLTGFGLGSPSGTTQIKVGGATATNITTPSPDGYVFGPFDMGTFQATAPAGSPGIVDVTVTNASGSTTIPGGYQYLAQAKVFPVTGKLGQIAYDRPRQQLYASNFSNNRVEVFSLQSETFGTPIAVGKNPEGLALTPDGTRLAVANAGDGTVSIIDPAQATVLATVQAFAPAQLLPDGVCGAEPLEVTAIVPHRVILGYNCNSPDGLSPGGALLLNLDNQSLDCTGFPTCNSSVGQIFVQADPVFFASTPDGTKAIAATASIIGLYDVTANTFKSAKGTDGTEFFDLAINDDGNLILDAFGMFNTNLQNMGSASDYFFLNAGIRRVNNFENSRLNPPGSLYYVPQPSGVDIFDVHHGRLVLQVSSVESIPQNFDSLAIDETGTKLFLISSSGLTIEQLAQLPLSIGSITPSSGAASGGVLLTIRGSGFTAGTTVTFGATSATATFIDANTLQVMTPTLPAGPIQVTVTNPDGHSYKLDASYNPQ